MVSKKAAKKSSAKRVTPLATKRKSSTPKRKSSVPKRKSSSIKAVKKAAKKKALSASTSRKISKTKKVKTKAAAKPVRTIKQISVKPNTKRPKKLVKATKKPVVSAYLESLRNTRSDEERVASLQQTPLAVCENDKNLQGTLAILRNREEPIKVRLAALQALQSASFSVVAFEPCRADYVAALRDVANDPDPELSHRVLGILSRQKDPFVEKLLTDGLKSPDAAILPPEKALQLLRYNTHSGAYQIARDIVQNPPNPAAKMEALRLLGSDIKSTDLFERVLRDKSETPEARYVSATALNSLHPDKLQEHAREILMDHDEQSALQATCLTAVTNFGDTESIAKDPELMQRVSELKQSDQPDIKQSAEYFLKAYGQ